jgi:hypothetical protein
VKLVSLPQISKPISLNKLFGIAVNQPGIWVGRGTKAEWLPAYLRSNVATRVRRVSKSGETYNSPRNVRWLCLSKTGAYIGYWHPPIENGRQGQLWKFVPYVLSRKS